MPSDQRSIGLCEWVRRVLAEPDAVISVASADASFRRYFRATAQSRNAGRTWIVMDAPPDKEDLAPYIKVADMLVKAGVNAPRVIERNLSEGYLLLSDLGDRTYLRGLADGLEPGQLYADALRALVQMQSGCRTTDELPSYNEALLCREMELFPEWFMAKHLGIAIATEIRTALDTVFTSLMKTAMEQPRVFVHRDYHSRNLMVSENGKFGANPGVLDFQDAVVGPVTYDLVSLLRDCYVEWPLDRVHGWLRSYREQARAAGLDVGRDESQFIRWFDLMGVQRHLKAVGIFARLWHRDGKRGYLSDIPRTLGYIRAVAPAYVELRALAQIIDTQIAPVLTKTSLPQ